MDDIDISFIGTLMDSLDKSDIPDGLGIKPAVDQKQVEVARQRMDIWLMVGLIIGMIFLVIGIVFIFFNDDIQYITITGKVMKTDCYKRKVAYNSNGKYTISCTFST